jgi:hypothetical protein
MHFSFHDPGLRTKICAKRVDRYNKNANYSFSPNVKMNMVIVLRSEKADLRYRSVSQISLAVTKLPTVVSLLNK